MVGTLYTFHNFCFFFVLDRSNKVSAKGIFWYAQKQLTHDRFKDALFNHRKFRVKNTSIRSKKHELQTVNINKLALTALDTKRFLLGDLVTCLPFGHFLTREDEFNNQILLDDWEGSLENNPCSSSNTIFDNFITQPFQKEIKLMTRTGHRQTQDCITKGNTLRKNCVKIWLTVLKL